MSFELLTTSYFIMTVTCHFLITSAFEWHWSPNGSLSAMQFWASKLRHCLTHSDCLMPGLPNRFLCLELTQPFSYVRSPCSIGLHCPKLAQPPSLLQFALIGFFLHIAKPGFAFVICFDCFFCTLLNLASEPFIAPSRLVQPNFFAPSFLSLFHCSNVLCLLFALLLSLAS